VVVKDLVPVQNRVAAVAVAVAAARIVDHMTSSEWRIIMGSIGHAGIVITKSGKRDNAIYYTPYPPKIKQEKRHHYPDLTNIVLRYK